MDDLYFNLKRKYRRNIFRTLMGAVLLAFVTYFIITKETYFGTGYLILFTLAGLYYLLMGLGLNLISVWGKAFIRINQTSVQVKPAVLKKATTLQWSNIKEIQIKVMGIRFLMQDGDPFELEFNKLNDENIKDLKHAIIGLSKEKGVKLA